MTQSFDVERIARTCAMRKACLNWASLFFNHTWTSFSLTTLLVLELDCFSPLFADFCPFAGVVLSKSGCLGGVCIWEPCWALRKKQKNFNFKIQSTHLDRKDSYQGCAYLLRNLTTDTTWKPVATSVM